MALADKLDGAVYFGDLDDERKTCGTEQDLETCLSRDKARYLELLVGKTL